VICSSLRGLSVRDVEATLEECFGEQVIGKSRVERVCQGTRARSSNAWQILDGTDGAASGVEHALNAALASIDTIYSIEHVTAYNADVASQVEVQDFWERHGNFRGLQPDLTLASCPGSRPALR
jgi:hypothetical protein